MRLLMLAFLCLGVLSAGTPATACRNSSLSVQMVFDSAPEDAPEGARVLRGRITNHGPLFEAARSAQPVVDVPGDFDAALVAIIDPGDGTVVRIYEAVMTSCNGLFGRDYVFDLDGWIVGWPVAARDGSPAIDPVGRRRSGEWTEF